MVCKYLLIVWLVINASVYAMCAPINKEATELFAKAEQAYKAKDIDTSLNLLLEALKKEPDNSVYRYVYGRILFEKGDYLNARENLEIVAKSRPIKEKGQEYNEKLKNYKKKIKSLQDAFNAEGQKKFDLYLKNQDSKDKIKLAVTLYQAFKLNPPLRYKNYEELKKAIEIYEKALESCLKGQDWKKQPMLQLAFLYEISNRKEKASEIYMRALDYVEDPNEEFIVTHKFDYLNRSNKEKLLDTIEAGEFSQKDIEELLGAEAEKVTAEERKQIEDMIAEARAKLENATSEEEREQVLEEIKATILEKQKKGELPGQKQLEEKLKKEGKKLEDYLK